MAGKEHRKSKAGKKAEKRKTADKKKRGVTDEQRKQNPKAFAFQSAFKAKAQQSRSAEREQKRLHGKTHMAAGVDDFWGRVGRMPAGCPIGRVSGGRRQGMGTFAPQNVRHPCVTTLSYPCV